MREGLFIKKNKDRWERLEHQTPLSPDEMASDFTKLVDDLGYAKTFYPTSRVTKYINSLAARIYLRIYKNRKEESNRLVRFFKTDVPFTIGKHHRMIVFALIIFCIFFAVGFFSSANEPTFVRQVLGNEYVDMTEKNIEEGNPFDVYNDDNAFLMFIRIMENNIRVSFYYFFRGIALGIPSLTALGKESIRIGAFEQMFFAKGLGGLAVVTVLIHGMLELTAIIIACAAGFVMGTSFLFPKTGSRFEAFRQGTKDGVKMVIGLMPVFMVAAFFESYFTRHYKMPIVLSIGILLLSASFIAWYFVVYPIKLKNRMKLANEKVTNV